MPILVLVVSSVALGSINTVLSTPLLLRLIKLIPVALVSTLEVLLATAPILEPLAVKVASSARPSLTAIPLLLASRLLPLGFAINCACVFSLICAPVSVPLEVNQKY